MLKFFFKAVLLISFIMGICSGVHLFIGPFWGHSTAAQKWDVYHNLSKEPNTIFIGSSRIYKHIIPIYFDSLALNDGHHINSFNFGVNSFPAPQSIYMMGLLLEETNAEKYYFLEVTPIYDEINAKIINTPEWNYWYNLHHLSLLSKHILIRHDLGNLNKIKRFKDHFQSFLGNIFIIGSAQLCIEESLKDDDWLISQFENQKGFVSFESAIDKNAENEDYLIDRYKKFHSDTHVIVKRIKEALKLKKWKNGTDINSPYIEELKKLKEKTERNGGKLFFIIPPRLENYSGYRFLSDLYELDNVIDLSDPVSYPEFYQTKNSFDIGHLNLKGARVFTEKLYQLIKEKNGFIK